MIAVLAICVSLLSILITAWTIYLVRQTSRSVAEAQAWAAISAHYRDITLGLKPYDSVPPPRPISQRRAS